MNLKRNRWSVSDSFDMIFCRSTAFADTDVRLVQERAAATSRI